MIIVITLIAAIAVFFLTFACYYLYRQGPQTVSERLGAYLQKSREATSQAARLPAPKPIKLSGWRIIVRWLGKYLESPRWPRLYEHKLIQAGLPLRGSEFMAICLLTTIAGGFLLLILVKGDLYSMLIGAAIGYITPLFILNMRIARRAKSFNEQLGDALMLIANSLRTGYSFMQAIDMVAREMLPPISTEFSRVLKEMNLGVTTEDSLNNLAKRVDSDDLDLVITAVLIQRQVGGNLAEVLDNIAGTIRERVRIKREIKTLTAQGRISGMIISVLPVGLGVIIYFINREYIIQLFNHPMGVIMLIAAAVSQLIGIMIIRRIVDIEV